MNKTILTLAAAALAIPSMPAAADPPPWAHAHGYRHHEREHYRERAYDRYGRYYHPRVITRRTYIWRGRDGRYYCRRDNGTTGLIIGAAGGAFVGNALSNRRDRTAGTIVGAALGALLGHEIDRGQLRCR